MKTTTFSSTTCKATLVVLEVMQVVTYDLSKKNKWYFGRRTPENEPDIKSYSQIVSRHHGEFMCIDNEWFYVDKGGLNGTYLNGHKIKHSDGFSKPILLNNRDILRIDSNNLQGYDNRGVLLLFLTEGVNEKWESKKLSGQLFIGRDKEVADIVLNYSYVSGIHASITYNSGNYYISDCNSLAGTWLNGKKLTEKKVLKEKDNISICNSNFIFTGDSLIYNIGREMLNTKNVLIKADINSKKVDNNSGSGKKELIRDVHLEVKEGSLVALLGSSGAGKTTVMNCLNGMDINGVDGRVFLKDEDLYENFERLKFIIGSVPQKEVFHPMLTVEEELKEAAIMRLPRDTTPSEINNHVNETIRKLGLESVRKSKIQKCSGGEQRRVNIGIELVADRKILCLDEPDAGLDPGTKKELFTILQQLAHNENKSILVIIHDVSDIELFDQIIMMAKVNNVGRLAFSGSPKGAKDYFGTDLKEAYTKLSIEPEKYVKGL